MSNDKENNEKIPQPYWSALFHPHITWIECFINWIVPLILPMSKMIPCKPDDSPETVSVVKSVHERSKQFVTPALVKVYGKKWSKIAKCPIGEHVCTILVQKDIFQEWGICDSGNMCLAKRDEARVLVRFPTSVLSSDVTIGGETDGGFVNVKDLDLRSFALDATVLLQFHGGGFVIGTADDSHCLGEAPDLMEHYAKRLDPNER
jgi:hypothetical protein